MNDDRCNICKRLLRGAKLLEGCFGHDEIPASSSLADRLFNGQLRDVVKLGWIPEPEVPNNFMRPVKEIMKYWPGGPTKRTLTMRIDFKDEGTVLIDMKNPEQKDDGMEAFRIIKAYWDEGHYRD